MTRTATRLLGGWLWPSSLRQEPSAKTSSTGSVTSWRQRHTSSAPVACKLRHSARPHRPWSTSSSISGPSERPSDGASELSPRCSPPMAASTIAWVPHSTSPSRRTCGNAPCPRPPPGRPNAAWLAGVSATSRVVPSSVISRNPRYHAPGGRRGGKRPGDLDEQLPQRRRPKPLPGPGDRAFVGDLPGAPPAPGPGEPLDQQPHDLLVAHLGEQAHRQRVIDHHPGGQQPLALLGPATLGDHPIHQLGREGPGQHPDRDPIRQAGCDWWLGLAGAWHPSVITSGRRTLPDRH